MDIHVVIFYQFSIELITYFNILWITLLSGRCYKHLTTKHNASHCLRTVQTPLQAEFDVNKLLVRLTKVDGFSPNTRFLHHPWSDRLDISEILSLLVRKTKLLHSVSLHAFIRLFVFRSSFGVFKHFRYEIWHNLRIYTYFDTRKSGMLESQTLASNPNTT